MASIELLCQLLGINPNRLTAEENLILEAELFTRICEKLKEIFKAQYKKYFSLINLNNEKENAMLESNFLRFVINDILLTEEYSLAGIACYTQIPEDVICDVAIGKNITPSLHVSRKIIDLHRSVRKDLYKEVSKKVAEEYLKAELKQD